MEQIKLIRVNSVVSLLRNCNVPIVSKVRSSIFITFCDLGLTFNLEDAHIPTRQRFKGYTYV